MNRIIVLGLGLFFFTALAFSGLCAEEKSGDGTTPKTPQGRDAPWHSDDKTETSSPPIIKKVSAGVFAVGDITVNKKNGFVSAQGEVNMDDGLVEYLACGPAGKLHESVLLLHTQPYDLQVALLLVGMEPASRHLESQGGDGTPEGDPVEIWVSWQTQDKKTIRRRAEQLIRNEKTGRPMQQTHWIYTGSQVVDGKYMAQLEQSVAATYHDPFAMFDQPLATGMDDTLYHVNKDLVPIKGTPVTFEIRLLKKGQ